MITFELSKSDYMLTFQELFTDKALKLHYNRVNRAKLSNGLTMEYALHGDDNAPEKVVLIMGLLGDKEAWLPLVSAMTSMESSSKYQFVTFDNRGVGGSDKPWGPYSTCQMAHEAILLMNHLQWKSAHIVGASMGGMIAQELACENPSRVKSLALLVTTSSVVYGPSPTWSQLSGYLAILRSLLLNSQHATASTMLYVLFPDKFLDEKIALTNKRAVLYKHHIDRQQRIVPSLSGMIGQYAAVALHYMSSNRLQEIKKNEFPIVVMGA
ncbi:serine protease family S33, partial [Thraustotheca clavata]